MRALAKRFFVNITSELYYCKKMAEMAEKNNNRCEDSDDLNDEISVYVVMKVQNQKRLYYNSCFLIKIRVARFPGPKKPNSLPKKAKHHN